MKLMSLLLAAALVSGPAFAQDDPPPQDPNASPPIEGEQDDQGDENNEVDQDAEQPPPGAVAPAPVRPAPVLPAPVLLGDFVMKVATGLGLPPPVTGYTPESAAWALSLKGIKVRPELVSPLTEADAVAALTGLGYKIRTATPSRVMTSDRVDLILSTFIQPGRS